MSRDAPPQTALVVLNWNGSADTLACLASCRSIRDVPVQFIVCDNASRPDDLASLRSGLQGLADLAGLRFVEFDGVQAGDGSRMAAPAGTLALVHTGANLGFAGGVNVGLSLALQQPDVQHAWILNNDCVVAPDALGRMLARMAPDPQVGICGSTLVEFHDRRRIQAFGGARYRRWTARSEAIGAFSEVAQVPTGPAAVQAVEAELAYVNGASMLVSRRFIEQVGLMDERYFLYSEEHDWAHRGRQAGFRLAWAPGAVVHHKHGATIGTQASGGSALSLFYLFRNKALFTERHHPACLPTALIALTWQALKFALKGQPDKCLAALRGLAAWPRRRHP